MIRRLLLLSPLIYLSKVFGQTTVVPLNQIAPLPALTMPRFVWEEPTTQTGDTFIIFNHMVGWHLPVVKKGVVLRYAIEYTLTFVNGSHTLKLSTPLQTGEWVAWQKTLIS